MVVSGLLGQQCRVRPRRIQNLLDKATTTKRNKHKHVALPPWPGSPAASDRQPTPGASDEQRPGRRPGASGQPMPLDDQGRTDNQRQADNHCRRRRTDNHCRGRQKDNHCRGRQTDNHCRGAPDRQPLRGGRRTPLRGAGQPSPGASSDTHWGRRRTTTGGGRPRAADDHGRRTTMAGGGRPRAADDHGGRRTTTGGGGRPRAAAGGGLSWRPRADVTPPKTVITMD